MNDDNCPYCNGTAAGAVIWSDERCHVLLQIGQACYWQGRIEDAIAADEIMSLLMGEKVEPRREFIEQNSKLVLDLDI